jgi:hypothetical protein
MLVEFLASRKPKVKVWQKLLGTLNHVAQVITSGRVYLGSVYGALTGILSSAHESRRNITSEIRDNLQVWLTFLEGLPPR